MHDISQRLHEQRQAQISLLGKINRVMREELESPDLIFPGENLRSWLTPGEQALARSCRLLSEEAPDLFSFDRLIVINFALRLLGLEAFRPYLNRTQRQHTGTGATP